MSTAPTFRDGDVVSYVPESLYEGHNTTHCREGMAVHERGQLVDTYWGIRDSQCHVVTDAEAAKAALLFNVEDFDELDRYRHGVLDDWMKYAESDRARITSQHGLQARYFVRKGATEHLPTQIGNAERRLDQAREKLRSAQWSVEWAEKDLAEIKARAS